MSRQGAYRQCPVRQVPDKVTWSFKQTRSSQTVRSFKKLRKTADRQIDRKPQSGTAVAGCIAAHPRMTEGQIEWQTDRHRQAAESKHRKTDEQKHGQTERWTDRKIDK